MGDYLTYAKLTTRIPSSELRQLLDVAADGEIETVANDLIADVEAEVLSYIRARRTPPDATASRMLAAICFRRFIYRATADRRSVSESEQRQFDADQEWLRDYRDGKLLLDDSAEAAAGAAAQHSADTRVFTRDTMEGF